MWIKLLGICLVCVSCAGIGGGEALRLIGRRRFLEEVKRIAAGLQGEIGYTQAVLPGRAGDSSDVRNRGMGADVPVWKQHRVSRSGNAAKDAGTVSGRIGTGD